MELDDVRPLAADGVVQFDDGVVLLRRDTAPFEGAWVLPGGFVERDEGARAACEREIAEEIGIDVTADVFLGLYDDPSRDPRGNVSAAFRCRPDGDAHPKAREEAREVDTFPVGNLPEMGFDHERIVRDAVDAGD